MTRGDLARLKVALPDHHDAFLITAKIDGREVGKTAGRRALALLTVHARDLIALAEKRAEICFVEIRENTYCNGAHHTFDEIGQGSRIERCDCDPAEVAKREIT